MSDLPDIKAASKHPAHAGASPPHDAAVKHGVDSTGKSADAKARIPVDPARDAYDKAQQKYQQELTNYWQGVDKSKHAHQKVANFPPFYHGPEKPLNYDPPKTPSTLPSVNDMTQAWRSFAPVATGKQNLPGMTIEEPSESEFKHAYAREAINVGAKYGLSKGETQNIVQSIYAFEDGGRGTADMLSGVPMRLTAPDAPGSHANRDERRAIHPLSTAIGYNQMLMATSLRFVDAHVINNRLAELAKAEPQRAGIIAAKERVLQQVQKVVHSELMDLAKTDKSKYLDAHGNPNYALYTEFARSSVPTASGFTGRQVTSAVQALNLDRDIGPVLQAQELNEIVEHGLRPTFKASLQQKTLDDASAARVYDHLPAKDRAAGVRELVDRVAPDSSQDPASVKKVIMQADAHTPPGKETLMHALTSYSNNDQTPLTPAALGPDAYSLLSKALAFKKYGDVTGPLHAPARALVDKLGYQQMRGPSAEGYLPAAVELANLAGGNSADDMLKKENASYPTVNFFDQKGYQANGIVNGRTADELVKAIYRNMHGQNGSPDNYGMRDMINAFKSQ